MRVPPPAFPAVALVLGWGLGKLWPLWIIPTALRALGTVLAALSLALMIWAILVQTRSGTDPNPYRATTRLVVHGPYRFSRNPIYLADLGLQAGIALASQWWWALLLLPATWAGLRFHVIAREEAELTAAFGKEYTDYLDAVGRWFGRRKAGA